LAPQKTDSDVLLRVKHTATQTALDRDQRAANVKGVFAIQPLRANELKAERVVLVDDVMTSGASLFSAAATLRQAGVASVVAVVLARTG
jgi:predicted amidophosphoribosyltransferase